MRIRKYPLLFLFSLSSKRKKEKKLFFFGLYTHILQIDIRTQESTKKKKKNRLSLTHTPTTLSLSLSLSLSIIATGSVHPHVSERPVLHTDIGAVIRLWIMLSPGMVKRIEVVVVVGRWGWGLLLLGRSTRRRRRSCLLLERNGWRWWSVKTLALGQCGHVRRNWCSH